MNEQQDEGMTNDHVVALAVCMLSTAQVDGVRPEEIALIRSFYEGSAKEGIPSFDSLAETGAGAIALLGRLAIDVPFAERLVLMCLMTGYADGRLSPAEHSHVSTLAAQVGVPETRVAELLVTVKDSLIESLAHLPDSESVAALAKTL